MPDLSLWQHDQTFFTPRLHPTEAANFLPEDEGALSVDVFEYPEELVVVSPIAGVRPENLDLALHHDMLTIRGKRIDQCAEDCRRTLHQECHWGKFSRSIILPAAVRAEEATAALEDGILTIHLPKALRGGAIPIVKNDVTQQPNNQL